jgi:uncharacterized protein YjiS (DUF1127 family)
MPADNHDRGPIDALRRLALLLNAWRRRRARRRARLNSFMGLSDRALADIGVRRADVHGAMIGGMPLRRRPVDYVQFSDAAVCRLPERPRLAVVSNDLGAAA